MNKLKIIVLVTYPCLVPMLYLKSAVTLLFMTRDSANLSTQRQGPYLVFLLNLFPALYKIVYSAISHRRPFENKLIRHKTFLLAQLYIFEPCFVRRKCYPLLNNLYENLIATRLLYQILRTNVHSREFTIFPNILYITFINEIPL